MDVTPQELRGSEIKEAFRGYHRDEVDDLLERAAVTIENLTRQLQEAPPTSRPQAEARLAQLTRNDADTIQRTLLLAQRAADDAIAEAQERAREILDESEAKAQTLVGEAETTARRIHEGERRRLEAEIAELIARRARLQTDADALESYASGYRDRVRAAIESDLANLGSAIDAPSGRPVMSEVDVTPRAPEPEPASVASYAWDDEPATRAINLVDAEAEAESFAPTPAPVAPPPAPPAAGAPVSTPAPAAAPAPAPMAPPAPAEAEAEWPPPAPSAQSSIALDTHAPWEPPAAMPDSLAPEAYGDTLDVSQPFRSDVVMEAQPVDTDVLDDDAFFASLRDAVRDDAPLGPVDDGFPESSSFFDDAQPEEPSRRFRRR